jgi:hypothetical protein
MHTSRKHTRRSAARDAFHIDNVRKATCMKTSVPTRLRWLSLPLLLAACGGGSSAGTAAPAACAMSSATPLVEVSGTRVLLQVKPSQASSCITSADDPSQALLDSSAVQKGLLAVFLPGTGGLPAQFPAFLQRGGGRGYHVIGLTYLNSTSVNVICNAANGNAGCAGAVREESLSGRDTSPLVAISTPDAIEGRLAALLAYLHFHRPNDGWSQFLATPGAIAWNKVSISGNSQGAGHAGYIAKVRSVNRVGMYAGPSDWVLASNTPVDWYSLPSLTPAGAFYGFVHAPDTIANASGDPAQVTTVWGDAAKFGMTGPVTNIAGAAPPYGGSHRLTTSACTGTGSTNEHNCPMVRGNEVVWDVVSFP